MCRVDVFVFQFDICSHDCERVENHEKDERRWYWRCKPIKKYAGLLILNLLQIDVVILIFINCFSPVSVNFSS